MKQSATLPLRATTAPSASQVKDRFSTQLKRSDGFSPTAKMSAQAIDIHRMYRRPYKKHSATTEANTLKK